MNEALLHHEPDSPYDTKPSRPHWLWIASTFLAIYVLSIGPATWLQTKMPSTQPFLDALYRPLGVLSYCCPPIGKALLWYIGVVWRVPIDL